jgi:SulP family sulfate permease
MDSSTKLALKLPRGVDDSEKKTTASQAAVNVSAGFVVAIFTVIASASFASLIFSGPLSIFVPSGVRMALTTAVVVGALVGLTSSCRGAIAIPQDRIVPILALLAAGVATGMPTASVDEKGLAIMSGIVMVTLLTGLFLYALGRLRLGNLIRYIPYPVIGGFLAGSGWLLALGGLRVMTGHPIETTNVTTLLRTPELWRWTPGLLLGLTLFWLLKRVKHQLLIPALLAVAITVFYVAIGLAGRSVADARDQGWLLNIPNGGEVQFVTFISVLKNLSWGLLANNLSVLATILVTSVVSILLTATALELSLDKDIDLNRELCSAGAASFVSGLAGGMVGFHSLSMSRLALSMGARSRWVGVVAAFFCGVAFCAGPKFISMVPRFVCGGLLIFLGLIFLWEWVFEASNKLTKLDYFVVLFILAIIGAVGYPEGVAAGTIAAVVLFVHNYSRVDVVSHAMSGADLRSNVDRPVSELKFLREHGEQIYVLHLQGFIFFGTANHLLQEVKERAADLGPNRLRFVVMDFRRVTGIDSSAVFSLGKVHQLAQRLGFTLMMTQVSPEIEKLLVIGGLRQTSFPSFRLFPDLDHGLEWCERLLLKGLNASENEANNLCQQLREIWPVHVPPERLLPYLERDSVGKDTYLIRQGDRSECLYFIESGRVTARLELAKNQSLRLRSMGAGTVVGEVGMFLNGQRMASVVTEEDCIVYRLSAESLNRLCHEDLDLALALHQFMLRLLAERLTSTSNMLRGFQEQNLKRARRDERKKSGEEEPLLSASVGEHGNEK